MDAVTIKAIAFIKVPFVALWMLYHALACQVLKWLGKASFLTLQDVGGRIQCYLTKQGIGETAYEQITSLWDIGAGKHHVWNALTSAPEPVGYNPAMIPGWDNADSPGFDALRLIPHRLRVMPGESLMNGTYAADSWRR